MFKRILLFILISNTTVSIFPAETDDPGFCIDSDKFEEFDIDYGNLVECMGCGDMATFIFFYEDDIVGLCVNCYLND